MSACNIWDSHNSWLYGGNPCYDCTAETGRTVGCHSVCEKHLKWLEEKEERKAAMNRPQINHYRQLETERTRIKRVKTKKYR